MRLGFNYNKHGVSSALVHNVKGQWLLADLNAEGFYLVEIRSTGALGNGAITRAIAPPEGHEDFRNIFESQGLKHAARQRFVKSSNIKRAIRERVMAAGVKVKRVLIPSSRPHD